MANIFTSKIDFDKSTFSLNLVDFRKFLIDNNVTVSIVSFAVAYYLKELIDSLYENILFCEGNFDFIEKLSVCILNIKIYIGKFIITLLKFVISVLLVFYIARFLNDFIN
tara:strand:+ start:2158 stop:2487 length:330 start_codon:yes stop_codon:yes gene_type:complete